MELFYIGYYVDSRTTQYQMTRLDGTTNQAYKTFFSFSALGSGLFTCVQLLMDVLYASQCDDIEYSLCSNVTNIGEYCVRNYNPLALHDCVMPACS